MGRLFEQWSGSSPELILPLAPSGGNRMYYRLQNGDRTAIGTYGSNIRENKAFLYLSRHFHQMGLPVPEIYAQQTGHSIYLQEDLGATTLYSYLLEKGDYFPDYLVRIYQRVLEELAKLQILGGEDLDYSNCFPKPVFDKESMFWDLNYFKYHFILPSGLNYDEAALEKDFHHLADFLLAAEHQYFMCRDFQSRNIMVRNSQPFFIDYQGGRKGALQYDVASLLFQAKANIPPDIREQLFDHYLRAAGEHLPIDPATFREGYYGFVLMRCVQVLGAYGFRGLYERKEHFLQSIPFALRNFQWMRDQIDLPIQLPELFRLLSEIIERKQFEPFDKIKGSSSLLTVTVQSFSYKKSGIPKDNSGNGGGFVFDCRFLHNPGRYEPYKKLTGRDEPVINFLKQHSNIDTFLNDIWRAVDSAVENYIERSFTHLQVNFGCTGGQHRSVYAADATAKHLRDKYGIRVNLHHLEQSFNT